MVSNKKKYFVQFRDYLNKFAIVKDDSFEKLCSIVNFRKVNKGEPILYEGQTAKKLYFVCEGLLISLYVKDDGSTHIKNFFLEGNFAGSVVSSLLYEPSSFGIQSLEDGVIMELDFKKYKQIIYKHDDLKIFYISYLEKNWVVENEKRQIAFATQTAMERYQTFLEEYPSLNKRVPQLHIASYLGVTPTQLSRIRKNL